MNRFRHTKSEAQEHIEKILTFVIAVIVLIAFLVMGVILAIKDAQHPIEETPTVEEIVEEQPKETLTHLGEFKVTAYCCCFECCNKRPDDEWYGITATGTRATEGRTVAVDSTVIPYGTTVIVDGHEYIAEDSGSSIKGFRLDIFFENHQVAKEFGVQIKDVYAKGVV